jgi:protein-disulfide isomerase
MSKRDESRRHTSEPSRREEFKARRKRQEQLNRLIPIILVGLFAVVLAAIFIVPNLLPKRVNTRPLARGLEMGDPNAAVQVEEFADFQCPACATFVSDFEPNIVKNYVASGKINFKFVPYSFLGPESDLAAQAAYCANDQGKFWEYHDTLYINQNGENQGYFTSARMNGYAKDLGLDTDQFSKCLTSEKYKQKVQDDLSYGQSKNIDRTPSFLVNGRLVFGDTVEAVIETAVNTAAKK